MCGICGKWNLDGAKIDPMLLVKMRDSMTHRGPDEYGAVLFSTAVDYYKTEPILFKDHKELQLGSQRLSSYSIGFGHRRLSIIDLDTGAQPMSNADGTIWIVFNGEIYNYRELRESLKKKGHSFRTKSDTEVLLHAYEEFGKDCPSYLNGIFAFAIWDSLNSLIYLARDHYGIKPLYYSTLNGSFYFASELKAILSDKTIPRVVDLDALYLCLTFRYTPSPWTLFKGIKKLPAGCCLQVTNKGLKEWKFRKDKTSIDLITKESEWVEQLETTVEKAIVRQMVSDVPISISLSSGVDSNTVLAIMHKHSDDPVNAFTVGFSGRENKSEIESALKMANKCNANFYSQIISVEDYSEFMSRYLWHLEEPIGNESAPAYYFVAKMARKEGIKVLLNGQGADEAFAGYGRYIGAAYGHYLKPFAFPPFRWLIPKIFRGTIIGERYHRFIYTVDFKSEEDRFLRTYSVVNKDIAGLLIRKDVLAEIDKSVPVNFIKKQLDYAPQGTMLEKMTYIDSRTILPDNLLLCEDKMSMAASVEARVPFLDLEFMAIAEKIPGKYKLMGLRDKYIHRKACSKWVGKEVTSRPQIGFETALDIWFKYQLGRNMLSKISSDDSFSSYYLSQEYIKNLINEHNRGLRNHQRILFLLLSIENWHETFF